MNAEEKAHLLAEGMAQSPLPFFVANVDAVVLAANPAAAPLLDSWKSGEGCPLPDNVIAACSTVFAGEQSVEIVIQLGEEHYRITVMSRGIAAGVAFFGQDVTQEIQAERQTELLARIPEEDPFPVFRVSLHGRIEYNNEAATMLLLDMACNVKSIPSTWLEPLRQSIANGAPFEHQFRLADVTWQLTFTPTSSNEYVYIFARDVSDWDRVQTELRVARDEAQAASRTKSVFLATMSHELRTPLNTVIGYSELLIEEAADLEMDPPFASDLQKIRSAGWHVLGLINDVLDLSKIEAGKVQVQSEEFSLREVFNQVIDGVHPIIERGGNELTVGGAQDLQMLGDPMKLKQILLNLLSNAAKFTDNGHLHLDTRVVGALPPGEVGEERASEGSLFTPAKDEPWLCIEVKDDGVGISAHDLKTMFRPFVQVGDAAMRPQGGTGLGLSISARYARLLGGRLSARSEVGVGSTFSLWLPQRFEALKERTS